MLLVDPAIGQQCRTDDDLARTYVQEFLRSFEAANAAANLAVQAADDLFHQRPVVADAARCVEVDELHHGILREALDPIIEVIELQFLFLALD